MLPSSTAWSDFALDHLTVLEGDLSKLQEDGGRYVAAVYSEDDYGNPEMDSHWARLGDIVTLRYVERDGVYNPDTGIAYSSGRTCPPGANLCGAGGEIPGCGIRSSRPGDGAHPPLATATTARTSSS